MNSCAFYQTPGWLTFSRLKHKSCLCEKHLQWHKCCRWKDPQGSWPDGGSRSLSLPMVAATWVHVSPWVNDSFSLPGGCCPVFVFEGPLMWTHEGSNARILPKPASNTPSKPGIIHPAISAWWTGGLTLHWEGGGPGPGLTVRTFGLGVHLCDPGHISPSFPLQGRTPAPESPSRWIGAPPEKMTELIDKL